MFNYGLKAKVSGLCAEISSLLNSEQLLVSLPVHSTGRFIFPGNAWWPAELGNPSSTGGQNDLRYAYFPQSRRLAILHKILKSLEPIGNLHQKGILSDEELKSKKAELLSRL
jgi:hypothetical protein